MAKLGLLVRVQRVKPLKGFKAQVESEGGPAWLAKDFGERWADSKKRAQLLDLIRAVEHEPAMMGVSHHIMAIARK